jgi:uncharacterized lipoprotein YehR (DUF1307 family)
MFWWTVENLEQIRSKYNLSAEEKLFIEIEQLRIQHLERIKVTYVKGNIPKYKSLKKSIEDRIKVNGFKFNSSKQFIYEFE